MVAPRAAPSTAEMPALSTRKAMSFAVRWGAEDPVRSVMPSTVSTTGSTSSRLACSGWPFIRDHSTYATAATATATVSGDGIALCAAAWAAAAVAGELVISGPLQFTGAAGRRRGGQVPGPDGQADGAGQDHRDGHEDQAVGDGVAGDRVGGHPAAELRGEPV